MPRRTTDSFIKTLSSNENKKEKLAIARFVTLVITRKSMKQATTAPPSTMRLHVEDAKDATTTTLNIKSVPLTRFDHGAMELTRLIPSFVEIANSSTPTVLSFAAADAALRLSVVLADKHKSISKLLRIIMSWKLGNKNAKVILSNTIETLPKISNSEWSEFVSTLGVTLLDNRYSAADVSKIASHIRAASNAVLSLPSSVRALCLRLSVIPKSQLALTFRALDTALSSSTAKSAPGSILLHKILTSSSSSSSSLMGYLATQIVTSMCGDDDEMLLNTLLNMLKNDKESSSSSSSSFAVHFVANYASSNSSRVLPKLFQIKTPEALEVIKTMCCSCGNNNRVLALHLIKVLENENLQLRVKAGDVLARCDSTFVIPRLCKAMSKSSSKKMQSAASRALERLLNHPETNLMLAMETLLDTLRCGWTSTIVDGDDVVISKQNKNDKTWHDRTLAALKKWSFTARDEKLVRHILVKVMGAPEDSSSFGFLRSIGSFLSEHRKIVMTFILERMTLQGKRRDDDDLFDRLRPELILKVIPDDMFLEDENDFMWNLIYNRAVCDVEFDSVRRLAAELLGRFPTCSVKLRKMIRTDLSEGIRTVRVQLYAFCNACMIREKKIQRDVVVLMYVYKIGVLFLCYCSMNTIWFEHTHTHTNITQVRFCT